MTEYRCEMTLEVRGEIRATAFPLRNFESIMRIRRQWYYFYGLASRSDWEIYFTHKSEMKECKPFRISQEFPYLIKSQIEKNEQSESEPTNLYCEPVNLAGGLIEVIGKRQGEVL
jgi:hypothetical protein